MFLSIITICKNEENSINGTLDSILSIKDSDFEVIVKDGNSKDNTNNLVKSYQPKFNSRGISLKHYIGKDYGIYEAMNYAIEQASGEWIWFVNAGDKVFDPYIVSRLKSELKCNGKPDLIIGDSLMVLRDGSTYVYRNHFDVISMARGLNQQGCLYNKSILTKRHFDSTLRVFGDLEYFCYAKENGMKALKINGIISVFYRGGISSTQTYLRNDELSKICNHYGIRRKKKTLILLRNRFESLFPVITDYYYCINDMKKLKIGQQYTDWIKENE